MINDNDNDNDKEKNFFFLFFLVCAPSPDDGRCGHIIHSRAVLLEPIVAV